MIPSPVPHDWVKHTLEYDRLTFWAVPYAWYLNQIREGRPFALARWSDGEWPCVLGREGANTDKHPYSVELRRDLTKTLLEIRDHGAPYIVGLQEFVGRQHPLNEHVHAWMIAHDLSIEWVSGEVFHRASVRDKLGPLFKALAARGVILVGPTRLGALSSYFPIRQHVEVPLLNCHTEASRIIHEVRAAIDQHGIGPVVSFSASMSTKYLVHEINKTHPEATLIDVGALWEPYVGVSCRKYHDDIVKRLQKQKKIGVTPTVSAPPRPKPSTSPLPSSRQTTPRVVVITCTLGPTDPLQTPSLIAEGVDYFCVTDRVLPTSSVWRPIQYTFTGDPARAARRVKLCMHEIVKEVAPDCDVYVWVDAAYELHVDPRVFIPGVLRADFALLVHPRRTSIIDEAAAILKRDKPPHPAREVLERQVDRYLGERYPDTALSSTGLFVRRNDVRTIRFNQAWWTEFSAYQHTRDQMSFDYTAWKRGMSIHYLEGHYRANPYATWHHSG